MKGFSLFQITVLIIELQIFSTNAFLQRNLEDCLISTPLGSLQGEAEISRNGKRYCSFKGVPYANTPKRFEEAKLVDPWTGTRDATKFGSICPQLAYETAEVIGDEDCLFLNIHYPLDDQCKGIVNTTDRLPVLVNIHGGSLVGGSGGEYGSKYIMDQCIILVSINYRLGALGFLSTNDGLIPGNLGFKDQVVALKWTQKNIDSFGGDPNSVTIMGLSAGSWSISSLIASPAATGLFHRAIAQSGSAIAALEVRKNPSKDAWKLAHRLNCAIDDMNNAAALKECFLAAEVKDILVNQDVPKWGWYPIMTFGPVVENMNATNPFFTVNPLYKLISGDFNKVPVLMGFTEDEGVLIQFFRILNEPALIDDLNTKWEEVAPLSFDYDEDYISQEDRNKFSKKIRDFYMEDRNVSFENRQDLINLHSDRYFVQGVMDTVELHSRYAPVYPYVFSYKELFCFVCSLGYPEKVATHGEELQLMFTSGMAPESLPGTPEAEYSEKYLKFLMSFVRTGIPSETWPTKNVMKPYKNDGVRPTNWYRIDKEITELSDYLKERRAFWRNLGIRHYDNPAVY